MFVSSTVTLGKASLESLMKNLADVRAVGIDESGPMLVSNFLASLLHQSHELLLRQVFFVGQQLPLDSLFAQTPEVLDGIEPAATSHKGHMNNNASTHL